MLFRYSLYGLEVSTELLLELPSGLCPDEPADMTIALGEPLTGFPEISKIVSADGIVEMAIAGVAIYRIGHGRSIEIAAPPNVSPGELVLFLLGSAFGILLQQRRILALHANALSDGRNAIAVVGKSGAGKSTLAARLCELGMKLLSDDVCAVGYADERAIAQTGVARFRLWSETLDRLGWQQPERQVSLRIDKWEVEGGRHVARPAPLRAIYALESVDKSSDVGFDIICGAAAVGALMSNSYRGDLLEMSGDSIWHFQECVRLARSVPIFRWRRRWGHEHGKADAAALLAHAKSLQPA